MHSAAVVLQAEPGLVDVLQQRRRALDPALLEVSKYVASFVQLPHCCPLVPTARLLVPPFATATVPVTLFAVPPMLRDEVATWYVTPAFRPRSPESEVASVVAPVTVRVPKVWVPAQVLEEVVARALEIVMAPVDPVVWSG